MHCIRLRQSCCLEFGVRTKLININYGKKTMVKLAILFYLFSILSAVTCIAQSHITKHSKIVLLSIGYSAWPIKLSKQWFEGDTIYLLTFRNAEFKRFRSTEQGFFKFGLKTFGKALQTVLSVDSGSEVNFSDGVIKTSGKAGKRNIDCHFATGTGLFRMNESQVKLLIDAIRKEVRPDLIGLKQKNERTTGAFKQLGLDIRAMGSSSSILISVGKTSKPSMSKGNGHSVIN